MILSADTQKPVVKPILQGHDQFWDFTWKTPDCGEAVTGNFYCQLVELPDTFLGVWKEEQQSVRETRWTFLQTPQS